MTALSARGPSPVESVDLPAATIAAGRLVPPREDFGEQLRRVREARRLSVRRLARLVAVSPSYLSRIERSHVPPPSDRTIARIAGILAIETDELLAAAGRVPEDVVARLLRRPRLMAKLVRTADGLPDDRVDALCGDLERPV